MGYLETYRDLTFIDARYFDADPFGQRDSYQAFQNAINSLQAYGAGGIITAPAGLYKLSQPPIISQDNIHWDMFGWGTHFQAMPGFPAGPMLKVAAPGGVGNFRYGIKIANCFFDGNNIAGVGGIQLDSTYGALLDHVRVRFCPGTGLFVNDPSSGMARGAYTKVRDCWFTDGGAGTAILSAFSENWTVEGGLIAFYNTAGGVGIKNQDGGCIVSGVQFDMCDTSFWQAFVGSSVFIGNNLGRAVSRHVYLNGAVRCSIIGNYFDMATGTPSPAACIYADNSANQANVIVGNTFIGTGNGWTHGYYEAGGIGQSPGNYVGPNNWNGLSVQTFSGHTLPRTVSVNSPDPGNNGTIQTTTGVAGDVTRVLPTANETGLILEAGTVNGQHVTVENRGNFTLTFAASGTSHVASGVSMVIGALKSQPFTWDSADALWY